MNTEEVVAMIDAITEGRYYAHGFETKQDIITIEVGREGPHLGNNTDEFWFSSFTPSANFLAKINDPRTAREIAGALVAWANRQDSNKQDAETMSAIVWGSPARVASKEIGMADGETSMRESREEWYRRNVHHMTRGTLERNFNDLKEVLDLSPIGSEEALDCQKAMNILHDSLMGIEPPDIEAQD